MRKVLASCIQTNLFSEEPPRRSPVKLPERRNLSVAPIVRYRRLRQVEETSALQQTSKMLGEEKHKFYVGPGNNGALVRRVMSHRSHWVEHDDPKYLFVNFRWQQSNKGFRYENCLQSKVFKQVVNHFEFHAELSNKEFLLGNLTDWSQHSKKNVFDVIPLTFVLNLADAHFDNHLNNFLKFFDANLPLNLRADNRKVWLQIKKKPSQHRSMERRNVLFFCKPNTPEVFYGFNSNYLWLLKPTFLNRGRGIHVFNDLGTLQDLMNDYISGKEELAEQDSTDESPKRRGPIVKSSSFIVQKYLEKPLLIGGRKFDIRVWVLITHELKMYWFKEGYLRTSSEQYQTSKESLDNLYIHLTNNAVQKNNRSYSKHEQGNQLAFKYLEDIMGKYGYSFPDMLSNGPAYVESMKQIIAMTGSSVRKKINRLDRMNCFEVFGYDFMLDETARLWLIEVNTNPCIEESSPLLGMLLPRMLDDAFKLTLDKMFPPLREETRSRYPVSYHDSTENLWEFISDLRK